MEKQGSSLAKSCIFQIRNIGRIRPYISNDVCKTLVSAIVTSRFDSGNALSFGVNASLITKLQRIQNTAARLITRTKKCGHITPVLMDLHWLPVCYITQYKLLLYVFKALNGLVPVYLKDPVTVYEPARTLHSVNAMLVVQLKVRTKTYGERRPRLCGIVIPATLDMNNPLKPSKSG
jgi:hypothetical protein